MAYLFASEYKSDRGLAQVFKLSGVNEWAVKLFEPGSSHPISENRFNAEHDAENFADNWCLYVDPAEAKEELVIEPELEVDYDDSTMFVDDEEQANE